MRNKLIALTSAIALACAPVSPAHAEDGYEPTNVVPGLTATVEPPLPLGAAWYQANSMPSWATMTPDGTIRLEPGEDITPGVYSWPVTATFADDTTQVFPVRVTVGNETASDASDEGAVIDAFVQYAPEVSHRCAATALGVGLPLLVLLPLGFASQLSMPFVARQDQLQLQVDDIPFQLDVKLRDLNSRDVDMGIAAILAAAGLAGAGAIISQCQ
ncbi:Rib/alpha-like domain-containing protein [uncultured Corynebacterium sp.]|uniref:Rib/alpha-like domain-containing protein n=1 Tax=uncultured Corynebacterium sp. TaxID=159447 RepID=UPI0025E522CC|nr:Rib/alpha-like domain-containing protein [uncultured Corynebacterium sp.]